MHCEQIVNSPDKSRWAVILAGGEGTRLRPLTRAIAGDERPKQFCKVVGNETLLQQTARRVARVVRPDRTKVVLTLHHQVFFDSRTIGVESSVIIQPSDRGTASAILYGLLSIGQEDPHAQAALFPADHYCSDDVSFTRYVDFAFRAVARQPQLVILLGVVPTAPEVEYGWIQPGEPVPGVPDGTLLRVRRFWEKPRLEIAKDLLARRCLWNSFVAVGSVRNLLHLFRSTVPGLYSLFKPFQPTIGTGGERPAISELYGRVSPVDFSAEVLRARPRALTVLPVQDASWTDMGSVDRVLKLTGWCGRESARLERAS